MSSLQGCGCGKPRPSSCDTEFQYAVKIVCGIATDAGAAPSPVTPGRYFTAVNIHNPSKCDTVTFLWKVAIAGIEKAGPVSRFNRAQLGPDQALELDCPQFSRLFPNLGFIKGYLVIQSPEELDVVAVYTSTTVTQVPVNTFFTERVPARCVPVCEDLVLPLSTGVAQWQTTAVPANFVSPPTNVIPVSPAAVWQAPPFGSAWVSSAAGDSASAAPGQYTYQLCFELCSGFANPVLQMQGTANNQATVLLSGTALGPTSVFNSPPATIPNNPLLYRPGLNCFQIQVINTGTTPGPTGFAISGLLRVARGRCPCSPLPVIEPASFSTNPGGLDGGPVGAADASPGNEAESAPGADRAEM